MSHIQKTQYKAVKAGEKGEKQEQEQLRDVPLPAGFSPCCCVKAAMLAYVEMGSGVNK